MSFLDHFYDLPKVLKTKNIVLFFDAMARENIKNVVIVFQNTFIKIL